jgi:hypothetical protein
MNDALYLNLHFWWQPAQDDRFSIWHSWSALVDRLLFVSSPLISLPPNCLFEIIPRVPLGSLLWLKLLYTSSRALRLFAVIPKLLHTGSALQRS